MNWAEMATADFWFRWVQIVILDLTLAGDNALVIALAVRKLPPKQQWQGRIWGTFGAVALRIVFIAIISVLLRVPFLQAAGGLALLWIAVKLLSQEGHGEAEHQVRQGTTLLEAIWIIIVADVVMSLDNVLAISGAAHGDMTLVIFGVALSIPIVIWGSGLLARLMARFWWIVDVGAGILGWVAGRDDPRGPRRPGMAGRPSEPRRDPRRPGGPRDPRHRRRPRVGAAACPTGPPRRRRRPDTEVEVPPVARRRSEVDWPSLEPVRSTRIYEEIVRQIRMLIADGHLKSGDRLPPERDLAERFRVSRTSVREAMRALESRGLIGIRPGEGAFVREVSIEALVEPLALVILAQRETIADLYEARRLLEPPIAALAARRATPEELSEMARILDQQAAEVAAGRTGLVQDAAFHTALAHSTHNRAITRIVTTLMDLLAQSREESLSIPGRPSGLTATTAASWPPSRAGMPAAPSRRC